MKTTNGALSTLLHIIIKTIGMTFQIKEKNISKKRKCRSIRTVESLPRLRKLLKDLNVEYVANVPYSQVFKKPPLDLSLSILTLDLDSIAHFQHSKIFFPVNASQIYQI